MHPPVGDLAHPPVEMRLQRRPADEGMAGNGVALDVADAALVLALGAGPIRRASVRMEAPIAGEGVQTIVETHLAGGRVMVIDQRPRIVEQDLLRHPAKALERALHAVEPGRLPLVPEGPDKRPSRVAQGRHKQVHPHPLAADRHRDPAKVDLQLLARRRLKPQARPRLGLQRLAQRHCRALHRPQRHRQPVLAQQVLAHHIAVAAMPTKTLRQPLLEPVETPLAARPGESPPSRPPPDNASPYSGCTPTRRQSASSPSPICATAPPPPPRPAPASSPPTDPTPVESFAPATSLSFLLLSEGSVLMSSGGQFFMSPDIVGSYKGDLWLKA